MRPLFCSPDLLGIKRPTGKCLFGYPLWGNPLGLQIYDSPFRVTFRSEVLQTTSPFFRQLQPFFVCYSCRLGWTKCIAYLWTFTNFKEFRYFLPWSLSKLCRMPAVALAVREELQFPRRLSYQEFG